MKTRKAILSLVALSLMFCSSMLAQQAPDNVAGDWTIYSTNIENGETVVKHVQITQSGNQLSGFFEGPVQSGPIQGEIHGNYIRFSTVTKNVLNFGGHVYGDRMSGSYGLHGKHAAWQAERQTPVAETATPVTGTVYPYQPVLAAPAPPPAPAPPASSPQTTVPDTQNNSARTGSTVGRSTRRTGCSHRAVSRCAGSAGTCSGDESRPGRIRGRLAGTKQEPDWHGARAVCGPAILGPQCQGSDAVSFCLGQSWRITSRGHRASGRRLRINRADVMAAVQTMRAKAQAAGSCNPIADHGHYTVFQYHRDSTSKPAGSLCTAI